MQRQIVPASFNRIAYKLMVGRVVTLCDVKTVDPEFFRNRFELLLRPNGVELMEQVSRVHVGGTSLWGAPLCKTSRLG